MKLLRRASTESSDMSPRRGVEGPDVAVAAPAAPSAPTEDSGDARDEAMPELTSTGAKPQPEGDDLPRGTKAPLSGGGGGISAPPPSLPLLRGVDP